MTETTEAPADHAPPAPADHAPPAPADPFQALRAALEHLNHPGNLDVASRLHAIEAVLRAMTAALPSLRPTE